MNDFHKLKLFLQRGFTRFAKLDWTFHPFTSSWLAPEKADKDTRMISGQEFCADSVARTWLILAPIRLITPATCLWQKSTSTQELSRQPAGWRVTRGHRFWGHLGEVQPNEMTVSNVYQDP